MANAANYDRSNLISNYDLPEESSTSSSSPQDPNSRLANIVSSDSAEDNKRLAFLRIEGSDSQGLFDDIKANIGAGDQNVLKELLSLLTPTVGQVGTTGYAKFCITGMQDSRSEKMQIMPVCGDSFIATFTGREPHIIGIQGNLIFDYDDGKASWYHAFVNAYEYYLRASRMAKHRCKMRMVFPDFQELVGYMINLTTSHNAESDLIVPFSFSMLVIDKTPSHPTDEKYWYNTNAQQQTTKVVDTKGSDKEGSGDQQSALNPSPDIEALKELHDALPSKQDYDTYNDLKTRTDNGEEISSEERDTFDQLTNKINNSGKDYWAYDEQKRKVYSDLANNGTINQSQLDELRDSQQRRYEILSQREVLTQDEQNELNSLAPVVGGEVLYRTLLDKKSSGQKLSQYEQIKLNDLETDYGNPLDKTIPTVREDATKDLSKFYTSNGDQYNPVVQPNSPASTAISVAVEKKVDPVFNTNKTIPNSNLADEVIKVSANTPVLNKQVSVDTNSAIDVFKRNHPDIRVALTSKVNKYKIVLYTSTPDHSVVNNEKQAALVTAPQAIGTALIEAYSYLYEGNVTTDYKVKAMSYITYNLSNFQAARIPDASEIWDKMSVTSNAQLPNNAKYTARDSIAAISYNEFMDKYYSNRLGIISMAEALIDLNSVFNSGQVRFLVAKDNIVSLRTDAVALSMSSVIASSGKIAPKVRSLLLVLNVDKVPTEFMDSTQVPSYEAMVDNLVEYYSQLDILLARYFTFKGGA